MKTLNMPQICDICGKPRHAPFVHTACAKKRKAKAGFSEKTAPRSAKSYLNDRKMIVFLKMIGD